VAQSDRGAHADPRQLAEPGEIYFSIVQRKVLTPNDLNSITALEDRLLAFQNHYQSAAKPLQWRFTRRDPASLLEKLAACPKAAWSAEYVTELPGWSTKLGAWRRAAAARALRLWRASGYFTKR